ncbi:MAG: D-alanyl-D-alanine carboxypeptidase [Phenylobacterium sp.]|jgi:D-alanyl-D-alanine carboxypeptidase
MRTDIRLKLKGFIMQWVKLLLLSVLLSVMTACGSGGQSSEPVPQPPAPTPTTDDTQTQLQDILDNSIAASATPGVVMAIVDEQQSWFLSSGVKDSVTATAIDVEDSLRIASMTKLLVATTVLKLAEENSLDIDGPMADYLDASMIDSIVNYDQITVRQLLNMTSGIADYTEIDAFNDAIDNNPQRIWQQVEVLAYINNVTPDFAPGSDYGYSNSNYVLLDLIVATVSNSSLAQEMRRIIFTPLAMESSYIEFAETSAANGTVLSVEGYEGSDNVTAINDGIGFGDGGVVSTVADLTAFLNALFGQKMLLSQASLDDMLTEVMGQEYGLGAEVRTTSLGPGWGHNGASSGFAGDMLYFADKKRTFVLLTNQADSAILDEIMAKSMAVLD